MTNATDGRETLQEIAEQLRNHVQARGGPAKDENGKHVGTVWPMMLRAAAALDAAQAEIARLEERFDLELDQYAKDSDLSRMRETLNKRLRGEDEAPLPAVAEDEVERAKKIILDWSGDILGSVVVERHCDDLAQRLTFLLRQPEAYVSQTPVMPGTDDQVGTARKAPESHSPLAGPVQVDDGGDKRPSCESQPEAAPEGWLKYEDVLQAIKESEKNWPDDVGNPPQFSPIGAFSLNLERRLAALRYANAFASAPTSAVASEAEGVSLAKLAKDWRVEFFEELDSYVVCTDGDVIFLGDPNHKNPNDKELFEKIVVACRQFPFSHNAGLEEAAKCWWESRRPIGFTLEQHFANPAINTSDPCEENLAVEVARALSSTPAPASSQSLTAWEISADMDLGKVDPHKSFVPAPASAQDELVKALENANDFLAATYGPLDEVSNKARWSSEDAFDVWKRNSLALSATGGAK